MPGWYSESEQMLFVVFDALHLLDRQALAYVYLEQVSITCAVLVIIAFVAIWILTCVDAFVQRNGSGRSPFCVFLDTDVDLTGSSKSD